MDASGQNKSYDIRIENFDISFGERWAHLIIIIVTNY